MAQYRKRAYTAAIKESNKRDKEERVAKLRENFPPGTLMMIKVSGFSGSRVEGYAVVQRVNANGTMTLKLGEKSTIKTEYHYQCLDKTCSHFNIVGSKIRYAIPV